MQGFERFEKNAGIMVSLENWRSFAVYSEQGVHCRLSGAHRIFDREHDVVWEFTELAYEGKIFRTFWCDLWPVAFSPA